MGMPAITSLENPKLKRIAIARDTMVGWPPGPFPVDQYKANLKKHGIAVPSKNTIYEDMNAAREIMLKIPESGEVKSWLSHLLYHLTSKAYHKGKYTAAVSGGKLLAELTGALAPPQEEDRSVDIATYLQLQLIPSGEDMVHDAQDNS